MECPMTNDYAAAFGRLMIATLFLLGGLGKIAAPAATQAYIASTGLPLPIAAYLIAVAVEIGGGLLLAAGYRTTFGAGSISIDGLRTKAHRRGRALSPA